MGECPYKKTNTKEESYYKTKFLFCDKDQCPTKNKLIFPRTMDYTKIEVCEKGLIKKLK